MVGGPLAHTRAEESERARGLSSAPELGAGPRGGKGSELPATRWLERACKERVLRSSTPTPGSGARTPASLGSRAPSRLSRQAPRLRAALLRPPGGKGGSLPSCSPGGGRRGACSGLSLSDCPRFF